MTTEDVRLIEENLAQVPIFTQMSTRSLRRLASTAHIKRFSEGEMILNEGEPGIALYVLARGRADVIRGINEDRPHVVGHLREGDFFGEMALLDTYVRTASVQAASECECITLTKWDFMAELRKTPDIAVQMLPVLGRRIRELEQQLAATHRE